MSEAIPEGFELDQPIAPTDSYAATPEAIPEGFELDHGSHSSPMQQVLGGIEAAGRGISGGLTDVIAQPMRDFGEAIGVNPDIMAPKPSEMAARQEESPILSHGIEAGTQLAGFLTGTGVPGAIAKVGGFVPEGVSIAGKLGSYALKGAIETGLMQSGNEISDAMLGHGDPGAPVSSALAHVGAAGLLGAITGGVFGGGTMGLRALADTHAGARGAQFIEDFGNRWKFNQENPDVADAVSQELSDFHGSTKAAADEVYGSSGLKSQAIDKLVPPMNEAISGQNQEIANSLQKKMSEMIADPETYPARLTKKLSQDVNGWMEVATNPSATSADSFNATQDLKQKLQSYAKFDKQLAPFAAEKEFVNTSKDLAHQLRTSLEDTKVWGQAGELQSGINKSFSDFLPALKDFERRFTTKVEGQAILDPGKIKTYVGQIGKPNAEIKQSMIENFLDAAEKYRNKIHDLHANLGIESPIQQSSLNATRSTLGASQSPGAKAADSMFHIGLKDFSSRTAHSVLGGTIGYHEDGVKGAIAGTLVGAIAPHIETAIARKLTRTAIPAAIQVLSSGNAKGIGAAIDYASHVDSGAQKIIRGINDLFKIGVVAPAHAYSVESNREKLRNFVEKGTLNNQIQEQASQMPPTQAFAHGGDVKADMGAVAKPAIPVLQGTDPIANHFPAQNMLLQTARGRISNYLNSIRPQPNLSKLPFDKEEPNPQQERVYNKVLDIANHPLSILNHLKDGTLDSQTMNHFSQLYPELYNHLNKKITEQITKQQIEKKQLPYNLRKSLSHFLGAPLDSSMTPASIQSVQAVFAQQKTPQQQAPGQKTKKGSQALEKASNNYKTPEQAAEGRKLSKK